MSVNSDSLGYDPTSADQKAQADRYFATLREECPVHLFRFPKSETSEAVQSDEAATFSLGRPDEFWSLTRYRDVDACLSDTDLFSSAESNSLERMVPPEGGGALSFADGEHHRRSRNLTQPALSPNVIRNLVPVLERRVDDLIDAVAPKGHMDVMADFALPLTTSMLQTLLGISDERNAQVTAWGFGVLGLFATDPEAVQRATTALAEIDQFVAEVGPDRVRAHDRGEQQNDAITQLLTATDPDYGKLSHEEVVSIITQLLGAGFETTATAICNGVQLLCAHPDELAKLRSDPKLISGAVEEALRYMAPAEGIFRTATRDTTIEGCTIRQGAKVRAVLASANMDGRKFDNPEQFRIDRPRSEVLAHMSFGKGKHTCIGNTLARQEMKVAFRALFERIPTLALAKGDTPHRNDHMLVYGYDYVPVEWDPESVATRS